MAYMQLGSSRILQADLEAIEAVGYIVGYGDPDAEGKPFFMLGTPPLIGRTLIGSDGRRYEGIGRTEPFNPRGNPDHAELIPFALYSQRRVAMGVGDMDRKERFERALDAWNAQSEQPRQTVRSKSALSM